jgi:hypothetical protein
LWKFPADRLGGIQSVGGMTGGHPDVDDDQLRRLFANNAEELHGVAGLPGNLETGPGEQAGEAFSKKHIVISQHNPDPGHEAPIIGVP